MPGAGVAEARLAVVWAVKRLYNVTPARVFFRHVDLVGGSCRRLVSIRRSDGKPFAVLGIKSRHPAIAVSVAPTGRATEHQLTISLNRSRLADSVWDVLTVLTDHAVQPAVQVPVGAFALRTK
jgi:hypothetical protein